MGFWRVRSAGLPAGRGQSVVPALDSVDGADDLRPRRAAGIRGWLPVISLQVLVAGRARRWRIDTRPGDVPSCAQRVPRPAQPGSPIWRWPPAGLRVTAEHCLRNPARRPGAERQCWVSLAAVVVLQPRTLLHGARSGFEAGLRTKHSVLTRHGALQAL